MNEFETEQIETELKQLKPAPPPENFIARCTEVLSPNIHYRRMGPVGAPARVTPLRLFRWLAPITAAAALTVLFFIKHFNTFTKVPPPTNPRQAGQPMKADNVEIVQQLVATFDAVAHLPSGEPVRFRCSEWFDDVVLRDSSQGISIQHRVPRLEVEPVRFETY